jgi:hypothetical protein
MSANAREEILAAAKLMAQAHGYAGLKLSRSGGASRHQSGEYLLLLPEQSRTGYGGSEALLGR